MAAVVLPLVLGPLGDMSEWTHIGGLDVGVGVPLLIMAGLSLLGLAAYLAAAELVDRGTARQALELAMGLLRKLTGGRVGGGRPAMDP